MADIESSVALDISDALGAVDVLVDTIRADVGGAFDDAIEQFQDALRAVDVAGTMSEDLGAAADLFGEELRAEATASSDVLATGLTEAGGVGAAAVGESVTEALTGVTDGLTAGLVGAAGEGAEALTQEGTAAIDALADEARGPLGDALAGAAQRLTEELAGVESPLESLDLSAATEQFEGLGAAARDAGDAGEDTAEDFGIVQSAGVGMGDALDIAQGHTGGLTGKFTALLGKAGPLGVGIAAAAGSMTAFALAGQKGVAAAERLTQVFGEFAPQLDRISVGGLNGELGELANKAGSTSAPLKQVLANLGQSVQAGGQSQAAAAGVAESFSALTLRAIALNPALGDAGQAGQRLFTAMSSGREKALIPFALGIDKASVQAKAFSLGLIQTVDQALTPTQRVMASVALATEKLGNKLGTDFANGADQAAVKAKALRATLEETFEKLGEAFVGPTLDFATRLVPIAEAVGRIAAVILSSFLPVLEDLTPLLETTADVLDAVGAALKFISPLIAPVVAGFLAFKVATSIAGTAFKGLGSGIETAALKIDGFTKGRIPGLINGAERAATAGEKIGPALAGAAVGVGIGASSLSAFGETAQGTLGTIGGFAVAGASIGSIFPGMGTAIGAATGALAGLTLGLVTGGQSVEAYRKKIQELGPELDKLNQGQAFKKFKDSLGKDDLRAFGNELPKMTAQMEAMAARGGPRAQEFASDVGKITDEIRELAKTSPGAARKVVDEMATLRTESGKPVFNEAQINRANRALERGAKFLRDTSVEQAKATQVTVQATSASAAEVDQINRKTAAMQAQAHAAETMVAAAQAALPSVGAAFQEAMGFAQQFGASITTIADTAFVKLSNAVQQFGEGVATPGALNTALQTQLDTAARFQFDLLTVLQSGNTQVAAFLAAKGPEAAAPYAKGIADAIRNGQPEVATAIEGTLGQISEIDDRLAGALSLEEFQKKLFDQALSISSFGTNLKRIAEAGFEELLPTLTQLGPEAGGEIVNQIVAGLDQGDTTVAAKLSGLIGLDQATKDKFTADIGELAPAAATAAQGVVDSMRTGLDPVPGILTELTPEVSTEAVALSESMKTGIHNKAREIPPEMRATMANVRDQLPPWIPRMGTEGEKLGGAAKEGIHGRARLIPPEFRATMDRTLTQITVVTPTAYANAFDLGAQIGAGLNAGLGSAHVDDAIANVAYNGFTRAKKAIKSESPSRLFAEGIGLPIAQGIAVGINEGASLIDDALIAAVSADTVPIQARVADVTGQARIGATPGAPVAGAVGGDTSIHVEKVVLEQASPNPTKETAAAMRQLRQGVAMAGL